MKGEVRNEVSKNLVKRFFLQIFIYAVVVLMVVLISYRLCEQRTWYVWDNWYPVVHWLHMHWVSVFLFALLFGCVVISCINFYLIARMMEQMIEAVDALYSNRANYISLPGALLEVEQKLNQIMANARESRWEAQEAEKRKNDMIVYMAHDLKTPLTSVIGYLTLLRDEPEISPALRRKYLDIAWNKSERLEELVNEFFEMTRYNFAHMTLDRSEVNISMMVEQILYEFKPLFQERGLDYTLQNDPEILVECDSERMERVFDNLLKNAINYSYENTTIHIFLEKHGEKGMKMRVQNSGKTIPPQKLDALFEQFFRLDKSRDSQTGGTGLGLAIARQIVELHGGTIRCESENETVTFILIL